MKRFLGSIALLALTLIAFNAMADDKSMKGMDKKDQNVTITGEIVDTGCYLGHGAVGTPPGPGTTCQRAPPSASPTVCRWDCSRPRASCTCSR